MCVCMCLYITLINIISDADSFTSFQVWELNTRNKLGPFDGHTGTVYALCVLHTPVGTKVFSASYDWSLRVSRI